MYNVRLSSLGVFLPGGGGAVVPQFGGEADTLSGANHILHVYIFAFSGSSPFSQKRGENPVERDAPAFSRGGLT